MATRLSTAAANGVLDSGFDALFNNGILELRTGSQPASADDAPTGTLLWSETLPADAFAAASARSKAKNGVWQALGLAAGAAGWFRLKQSGDLGTTNTTDERCDGAVTATGGGGEITLDNVNIAVDQDVTINTFAVSM